METRVAREAPNTGEVGQSGNAAGFCSGGLGERGCERRQLASAWARWRGDDSECAGERAGEVAAMERA